MDHPDGHDDGFVGRTTACLKVFLLVDFIVDLQQIWPQMEQTGAWR